MGNDGVGGLRGVGVGVNGSGTGGHRELGEEAADAAFDLVADRADVVDVEAAGSSSTQSSYRRPGKTGRRRRSPW